MYSCVEEFVRRLRHVNYSLLKCIQQIQSLPRFSGKLSRGVRLGTSDGEMQEGPSETDGDLHDRDGAELSDDDDLEDDDELQQEVNGIKNFIGSLRD